MNDDDLDALRAEVDRNTGPARARPLMLLGHALAQRYGGPARAVAPPRRASMTPSVRSTRRTDISRRASSPAACWPPSSGGSSGSGTWRTARPPTTGRGVALLDEAVGFPQLPPMLQLVARVVLGQLLMSRVTRSMQSPDFMMRAMGSGLSAEEKASAGSSSRPPHRRRERASAGFRTSSRSRPTTWPPSTR